jgi:hypothetical protein
MFKPSVSSAHLWRTRFFPPGKGNRRLRGGSFIGFRRVLQTMQEINGALRMGSRAEDSEPRQDCRRLQLLRGWGYDEQNDEQVFS